jgi:asparagine synthase (glutamine-hydrolysing)
MLYVDYRTWLVDDILVKVDRASMSHGLEVRSPFLDHRLFELCAALPAHWKMRGRRRKVILAEAMRRHVPAAVLTRRKAGFNAPVAHWLSSTWRDLVEAHLGESHLRQTGLLNPRVVRGLLDDHLSGRRDRGFLLFTLLQLSLWLDKVRPRISL